MNLAGRGTSVLSQYTPLCVSTLLKATALARWPTLATKDSQVECREITTSATSCMPYYVRKTYLNRWGRRDIKRRRLFAEHEDERDHLRLLKKTDFLPTAVKEKASADLAALPRDSCIVRMQNRCTLTSRSRGNITRYRISRIMFREFADKGLIAGYTRSSW